MKKIKKLNVIKDKDGKWVWTEKNVVDIRDGILVIEACSIVLAVKINEIIDVLNSSIKKI